MNNNSSNFTSGLIVGLIVGIIISLVIFGSSNKSNYDVDSACFESLEEYKDKLHEANHTIEDLNYKIEEAKSSAWEDYDEMGEALDSLETIDPISEP